MEHLVTFERHVFMNFARLASRVAIGGTAAALATAGLVGATGTTASAAPVHTTYTCVNPAPFSFSADVTVDIALLPSSAPAGFPVPAGLLSFKSDFTTDNGTAGLLGGLGVTGAKSDDFAAAFGSTLAKAPVAWTTATTGTTTTTFSGKGANAAFTLPAAGNYTVSMPTVFNLQGTNASGQPVPGITAKCTTTAPAKIGSIALSKQASVTKAKGPKSATKGKVVTLKVKVSDDYSATGGVVPTGKLIVKDGSKKVGKGKLVNGKAKIKVKGLKAGKHKIVVTYKGDSFNAGSKSKAIKLTVKG
jgi:hypothetical protein